MFLCVNNRWAWRKQSTWDDHHSETYYTQWSSHLRVWIVDQFLMLDSNWCLLCQPICSTHYSRNTRLYFDDLECCCWPLFVDFANGSSIVSLLVEILKMTCHNLKQNFIYLEESCWQIFTHSEFHESSRRRCQEEMRERDSFMWISLRWRFHCDVKTAEEKWVISPGHRY